MWPVGWEALGQWGDDVVRVEPLAGGVGVNEVWSVRVNGHLAVGRLGQRSDADLAWETGLLRHLDGAGMAVPVPVPARDGRHFAGGLVVMTCVEGGSPETEADWRRVAGALRQLHRVTRGWPQRPGWRSSAGFLHAGTGTRVDLREMPAEGVVRCRAAWARLTGRSTCVVHGDPNPGNIRMTAGRVAMIDWDESHVDVPDLDLALPHNAAGLDDDAYDIAAQARPHGKPPSAGTPAGPTSSQSSGSPKFERSEQQRIDRAAAATACLRVRACLAVVAIVLASLGLDMRVDRVRDRLVRAARLMLADQRRALIVQTRPRLGLRGRPAVWRSTASERWLGRGRRGRSTSW